MYVKTRQWGGPIFLFDLLGRMGDSVSWSRRHHYFRFPLVGSRRTHNLATYKLSSTASKTVIVYQLKKIVDECPLTKFEGRLNRLHEANDDAATAALVK